MTSGIAHPYALYNSDLFAKFLRLSQQLRVTGHPVISDRGSSLRQEQVYFRFGNR